MRKLLIIIPLIWLFSCTDKQVESISSTTTEVIVLINGKQTDWRISPEVNPDRLKVYSMRKYISPMLGKVPTLTQHGLVLN